MEEHPVHVNSRRGMLAILGSISIAGCVRLSDDSSDSGRQTSPPPATSTSTATDTPTPTPTETPSPTPTDRPDTDGDGVPNGEDEYPYDSSRQEDSDGDGVADSNDEYPYDSSRQEDSDDDGVANSYDDYPNNSNYTQTIDQLSETIDLNEGYYQFYEFDLNSSADLFYEVSTRGDIPIDVFITDETNFRYYEDDAEWEYYTEGSELSTLSAEGEFSMSAERVYYLVVDHTDKGRAEPPFDGDNNRLTIDVAYTLAR